MKALLWTNDRHLELYDETSTAASSEVAIEKPPIWLIYQRIADQLKFCLDRYSLVFSCLDLSNRWPERGRTLTSRIFLVCYHTSRIDNSNYQRFHFQSKIVHHHDPRAVEGIGRPAFTALVLSCSDHEQLPKSRIKTLIKILSNQKLNLIFKSDVYALPKTAEQSTSKSKNNRQAVVVRDFSSWQRQIFLQNRLLN